MDWKTSWSYLPINYDTNIGTVENITQRTYFKNNLRGNKVRVKFSNKYGSGKLVLEKAVISSEKNGQLQKGVTIKRHGETRVVLMPGEECYSDEIDYAADAGTDIIISIYICGRTEIYSACSTYSNRSWHTLYAKEGDFTDREMTHSETSAQIYPFFDADAFEPEIVVGISEIQVLTGEKVMTVSMFGDSITHMSYYADALMEDLYRKFPGRITVVNRGIGGNRILRDSSYVEELPGHNACAGIAAVKRFHQDVFETETPDLILLLEGVNDLMHPYLLGRMEELPEAEELIEAYTSFIREAHREGSRICLGTILPYNYPNAYQGPEGEAVRHKVNDWIRSQKLADGMVDFEKITASEKDASYMKDHYHLGDGLHPNTEGGRAMAEAVMEKFFDDLERWM